jgi:DNA invertase Pin-like site-specific DNA recombinase
MTARSGYLGSRFVPKRPIRYNIAVTKRTKTSRQGPKTTMSDVAVGYIRVSTDNQAESGAGLRAQRSAIRSEAARQGWIVAGVFEDAGASAKSLSGRPALTNALGALARGEASVLIVSKLDRLARSVHDFAGLVRMAERQGWAIVAVDLGVDMTSPTGGLMANITASVAEWERRIISVRTKEALAEKKAAGVRLGRPRLLDQGIADQIRSLRASGLKLQAIADHLNEMKVLTPTGRIWSPALVRKVTLQVAQPIAAERVA